LQKLKDSLAGLPKESEIIIYCGCCPFERCPNVRPAIQVLKDLNFTNYKLLNLPHNIKIDWIDKGYPSNN
jgi:thiosulfate/3-mercaptopyruvate sulfurtransferase